METEPSPRETELKRKILTILTGNSSPEKHRQDAEHVFEAQKYQAYFVTTDKRILNNRDELRDICRVRIMRPTEMLQVIEERVKAR